MHNAAFRALGLNWVYMAFEVAPDRLAQAIAGMRGLGIRGLNLTIPHKEAVIPLLNGLTDAARHIGAVNTLFWDGERLIGDNTDAEGFLRALYGGWGEPRGSDGAGAGGGRCSARGGVRAASARLYRVACEPLARNAHRRWQTLLAVRGYCRWNATRSRSARRTLTAS
jgi:shikimate dehydrogenase